MSKQTKKGNNGTASQNGKNAKKAVEIAADVNEIFVDVETLVAEPLDTETEQPTVETVINSEVAEFQSEAAAVEQTVTEAETIITPETIETPVEEVVTELQPETAVETIVAPEATEFPLDEVSTELQPEIVTPEQPTVADEIVITGDSITETIETADSQINDAETTDVTQGETSQGNETKNNSENETSTENGAKTPPIKKQAPKPPVAKEKKQSPKKATDESKEELAKEKKVTLAGSGYHWYRNWLRDWLRSHGVPSARFTKSPENYNGNIMVLESEKEKGVLALEQWVTENPDIKEMFWAVNK